MSSERTSTRYNQSCRVSHSLSYKSFIKPQATVSGHSLHRPSFNDHGPSFNAANRERQASMVRIDPLELHEASSDTMGPVHTNIFRSLECRNGPSLRIGLRPRIRRAMTDSSSADILEHHQRTDTGHKPNAEQTWGSPFNRTALSTTSSELSSMIRRSSSSIELAPIPLSDWPLTSQHTSNADDTTRTHAYRLGRRDALATTSAWETSRQDKSSSEILDNTETPNISLDFNNSQIAVTCDRAAELPQTALFSILSSFGTIIAYKSLLPRINLQIFEYSETSSAQAAIKTDGRCIDGHLLHIRPYAHAETLRAQSTRPLHSPSNAQFPYPGLPFVHDTSDSLSSPSPILTHSDKEHSKIYSLHSSFEHQPDHEMATLEQTGGFRFVTQRSGNKPRLCSRYERLSDTSSCGRQRSIITDGANLSNSTSTGRSINFPRTSRSGTPNSASELSPAPVTTPEAPVLLDTSPAHCDISALRPPKLNFMGLPCIDDTKCSPFSSSLSPTLSFNLSSPEVDSPLSNNLFNRVEFGAVARRLDLRTTIMIKNIPNKIEQERLKEWIDVTNERTYDFLYLRMDFKNKCNVGYAFINFLEPSDIITFGQARVGTTWNMFASEKVCDLSYANIQGKEALVEKFRNSCVMDEQEAYRPHIYHSSGPRKGLTESFPRPNNLSRKARSALAAQEIGLFPAQCPIVKGTSPARSSLQRSSSLSIALTPKRPAPRQQDAMLRSASDATY